MRHQPVENGVRTVQPVHPAVLGGGGADIHALQYAAAGKKEAQEAEELEREKKIQRAMLDIKRRFGKNAILKGMNLEEGATARERNNTIGGHRSG